MPPSILAVIPGRYASTRFPGKPLAQIAGKPMIQHVWERVCTVPEIARVVIATDDRRIADAAAAFGAETAMTSPDHPSGTDRVWEVARLLPDYEWVLNVQGDEPLLNPDHLRQCIAMGKQSSDIAMVTAVTPVASEEEWLSPNCVKAVVSQTGRALYFSRASVPVNRDEPAVWRHAYRHLGLYLYRQSTLRILTQLPISPLEQLEKLEQLRVLEAGLSIGTVMVDKAPIGVDTPEDLRRIQEILSH